MEKTYIVNGMSCVMCKANVESALNDLPGINSAIVSLMDNEVLIDFDENKTNEKEMAAVLKKVGYELVLNNTKKINTQLIKTIISILSAICVLVLSLINAESTMYIQLFITIIVIALNYKLYISGFKAILRLKPNMDTLILLSTGVSFLYSIFSIIQISLNNHNYHLYFETCVMIIAIISLGKYIENKSKRKTTNFIRGLSTLIPMEANLIVDGKIKTVSTENINKGDSILIGPGESIPQDGIIVKGKSNINESLITGESLPVLKTIGDQVIGGTVNIDGEIVVEINKKNTQTTLSKIISLTKQASMKKISLERIADKIANIFVFIVMGIAITTFIIWIIISKNFEISLNYALCVLVVACPCALGLATPSAIAVACNTASKNGILIKNPEIIEKAYKINTIVFDKTGTLTDNKLKIVKSEIYNKSFDEVISSLESSINHPIANSIKEIYKNNTITFERLTQIPGEGVVGTVDNDIYIAGNKTLLDKYNIKINNDDYTTHTFVGVAKNSDLLGVIFLEDSIKDSTYSSINELKKNNIKIIMATGDNENVAFKIAKKLSIDNYYAKTTPQDKQDIIEKEKTLHTVAMVGDGINDAVALTSADVSITLASGTDIANATSDVSLLTNNINAINKLIALSKKTVRIIKQNLIFSLLYNIITITLASGFTSIALNPIIGVIIMSISSITVITNALRIAK